MRKKASSEFVFVHIVRYADNSVKNSEWTGRIQNIRDLVLNSNNALKKDINERIGQLEGKLDETKKQNEEKLNETKEKLEGKLDEVLKLLQKEKKEE